MGMDEVRESRLIERVNAAEERAALATHKAMGAEHVARAIELASRSRESRGSSSSKLHVHASITRYTTKWY